MLRRRNLPKHSLKMDEITYTETGDTNRGEVKHYHHKPPPRNLSGAKTKDVSGLKKVDRDKFLLHIGPDDYVSQYRIGFEIEKNELDRDAIREYALICGFETDSSCGYEAVTNVLPLIPAGYWRNKVFDMIVRANRIIDDNFSPSNTSCSCHVNLSRHDLPSRSLLETIRPYMGIVYALWRKRLTNPYCRFDVFMRYWDDESVGLSTSWNEKYRVCRARDGVLEIRLPNRVTSAKQLMRRYELFYEIARASQERVKYWVFLRRVRAIVVSMYDGDVDKAKEVLELSKKFKYSIDNQLLTKDTYQFIDPQLIGLPIRFYDQWCQDRAISIHGTSRPEPDYSDDVDSF